ncbi:MAG: 5'/3'-nucleotidase SurE [Candidatus Cloacimonetes bacterium 4572_55]|nr:MAG: 5'/3'-nucleotidase SurE [Candidatus Cloacimonetes bacterium 4572_55]
MKKKILLTNDDGIASEGLASLRDALKDRFDVITVAPDQEQSGSGHSFTSTRPLRVTRRDDCTYSVDGSPTDCVMLAMYQLLDKKPDLLISGINRGQNMGDDVTYSGTVCAAFEGKIFGVPSIATSLSIRDGDARFYFEDAASSMRLIAEHLFIDGLSKHTLLNINFPNCPQREIQGTAITRLGDRKFHNVVVKREDPRGQAYYWIGGTPECQFLPGTDLEAVHHKKISITPLHLDMTDYDRIPELEKWNLRL